jgi:hypothetical protein
VQWAAGIDDPRDVIGDYDEQRWAFVRADADYIARALSRPDLPQELRVFAGAELERARAISDLYDLQISYGNNDLLTRAVVQEVKALVTGPSLCESSS